MTTYGTPEGDQTQDIGALVGQTQLDLTAQPAPAVVGFAPAPARAEPQPLVFLVVVPGLGVIDATYDEPTAAATTKKLGGVSIALPVFHDHREVPPIAADVTALLGSPPTATPAAA